MNRRTFLQRFGIGVSAIAAVPLAWLTQPRRLGIPAPRFLFASGASSRYYRVRWVEMRDGVVLRRSAPSPVGPAATIFRPVRPHQGETHWEIESSRYPADSPWLCVAHPRVTSGEFQVRA